MNQFRNYGDQRQTALCAYCGGHTESRDHVPSKVLLDQPYPENLPLVYACRECNEGFSLDEEYLACLIESVVAGTTEPEAVGREKVKRILARKSKLAQRIADARHTNLLGGTWFGVEEPRVRNVVLKLARGHALYELNEPHTEDPLSVAFVPLLTLSAGDLQAFEEPVATPWPEVGSRAMQRMVTECSVGAANWIVVQPGRYRYMAAAYGGVTVRMVIREYLACEVVWE